MSDLTTASRSKHDILIDAANNLPPTPTLVVHPCDATSLLGAIEARDAGLILPILVGPESKIRETAEQAGIDLTGVEIEDVPHSHAAAAKAVELVRAGRGELLMKGSLHTDELMREVTSSATGLRTGRRISHVFIMDVPGHAETLFITDAAINIFPDLDTKRDIIQNAIDLCHALADRRSARGDPVGGRNGDNEDTLDAGSGGVVQDGRSRPDHRRRSRRAAGLR